MRHRHLGTLAPLLVTIVAVGCGDTPSASAGAADAARPATDRVATAAAPDLMARRLWAQAASGGGQAFCAAMTEQARKAADWAAGLFGHTCAQDIDQFADRTPAQARDDAELLTLDVQREGPRALVRFSDTRFGQFQLVRTAGGWRLAAQQGDGTSALVSTG